MKIKPFLILLFSLAFFSSEITAQNGNYLVLRKDNSRKRIRYFPGDEFQFIVKGSEFVSKFNITHVSDTAIWGGQDYVRYDQIKTVYIPKRDYFIVPDKVITGYGVSIAGSYGLIQVAYLINTGKPSVATDKSLPFLLSPIPILYLSNWIRKKTSKKYYQIENGNYLLNPVLLDLQPPTN